MKILLVLPFIFGFAFMSPVPSSLTTRNYGNEIVSYIMEYERENEVTVSSLSLKMVEDLPGIEVTAVCKFGKEKTPYIEIGRKNWDNITSSQKKALITEQLNCAVLKNQLNNKLEFAKN